MGLKYRSAITVILLSIFTCGIYYLYWIASTQNALRYEMDDERMIGGGLTLFLIFITCGLYLIIWMYQSVIRVNQLMREEGLNPPDDVALIVLLGFFISFIVYPPLLQTKINSLVE